MTPEAFAQAANVSRETLERLKLYAALLERWQLRMNLVAPESLKDLWRRHFLDSAQLWPQLPDPAVRLADLGSGAGFPGLVLAILGARDVTLVESNQRKCAFLREVARATETKITIFAGRIEDFSAPIPFDVVTARALAPLEKLLPLAYPLMSKAGFLLLMKGKVASVELTKASKEWHFTVHSHPSVTDEHGVILTIRGLQRRTHDSR